jgi:hypothetical protein
MSDDYEAIRDALDDLASAVNDRYAGYPATDRRYVRDLAVVTQASAALQRLESRPTPEQSGETRDAARWKHVYDGRYIICRWDAEAKAYVNIGGSYVARDAIDAAMDRSAQPKGD